MRSFSRRALWVACGVVCHVGVVCAQTPDIGVQELLRQQERERVLREQQESRPDVRLEPEAVSESLRVPEGESPCFDIQRIALVGPQSARFQWALGDVQGGDDPATGRCLGTGGVNVVMRRVQNAIIARGYVTTRVVVEEQDLTTGDLVLTLVPGLLRDVRFAEDVPERASARNALPLRRGALLNLRAIEQALENFQRLPTVTADIQIVPAQGADAQPGESDLVIAWQQRQRVRVNLGLDDSGSEATGRWLGTATASLDGIVLPNDLFYVSAGQSVFTGRQRRSRNHTVHYDVPWGYWLLGATAGSHDYRQQVVGAYENYLYSGTSDNAELKLSWLLWRNAKAKTSAHMRGWMRQSDNFIDDVEIEVQRRRMAGWEVGANHRRFLGQATVDFGATYRRGTGAFGALPAPEELFDEGTARGKVVTAHAHWSVPWRVGRQALRYSGQWRAQWNRTLLTPQDRFAIGGRYTVRGFDGETSLVGDRGWLVRNDLGMALGGGQELYVAADYGRIGGPSAQWQFGRSLGGMALGLRGGHGRWSWDAHVGAPLHKPEGFPTAYTTFAVSAGWSY